MKIKTRFLVFCLSVLLFSSIVAKGNEKTTPEVSIKTYAVYDVLDFLAKFCSIKSSTHDNVGFVKCSKIAESLMRFVPIVNFIKGISNKKFFNGDLIQRLGYPHVNCRLFPIASTLFTINYTIKDYKIIRDAQNIASKNSKGTPSKEKLSLQKRQFAWLIFNKLLPWIAFLINGQFNSYGERTYFAYEDLSYYLELWRTSYSYKLYKKDKL